MKITILALGSTGDILPYAVLGQYLRDSDHDILFISTKNYESLLLGMNLRVLTIPGDAQSLVQASGANILSLFKSFADLSRELTSVLDPDSDELKNTDLILNQLPIGVYGYDLAEKLEVPMIQAAVIPLTPTASFPMMGWPQLSGRIGPYNRLSYRIFERLAWITLRTTINSWRKHKLDLPVRPLSSYWQDEPKGRPPMLYGFSQHILKRPADWDRDVHIGGYWIAEEEDWRPPDRLRAFIEGGKAPIFIGFGSMPVADPAEFTQMIVRAINAVGQRAIIHGGWAGIGGDSLGESMLTIDYAPYRWLFPRVTGIVHHGGSGTTGYGLWSGVPAQIVPFLFDQEFWGQRVAEIGAGPAPVPFDKLNLENLTRALDELANNQGLRQSSAVIGDRIRSENGLRHSQGIIESYMA